MPVPDNVRVVHGLGTESCPTVEAFRTSLAAHDVHGVEGSVYFAQFGESAFSVEVRAYGQVRFLTDSECARLLQPATLALALIVPLNGVVGSPVAPTSTAPSTRDEEASRTREPSAASPPPGIVPAVPPVEPGRGGIHVGGRLAGGLSRNPLPGISFGGWLRVWKPLSVGATANFFASDAFAYRTGRVENDMWGFDLEACLNVMERPRLRLSACGGMSIMDFQTRGAYFADNRIGRFVRVAALAAWQVSFEPILGLAPGFRGSLDVPTVRKSYDTLLGDRVWLMPSFSGSVTAQLNYIFR